MEPVKKRKGYPTYPQKTRLINLLDADDELRCGKFSASFTKRSAEARWKAVAVELNSIPGGAKKTWTEWRRTWQDMKTKKKKKEAAIQESLNTTEGGPPPESLSEDDIIILETISLAEHAEGHADSQESFVYFTDLKSRKQVTYDQMKGLLDYLENHQDLAKGLSRGRRGEMYSCRLWDLCAEKLNACNDGAVKDGKGWSKYWCDWKYRVRRKALELRLAKEKNLPPPEGIVPISHMEERILGLIGENALKGIVIKSDPLADEDADEDEPDNSENIDATIEVPYEDETRQSRARKRRSRDMSEEDFGGPSCIPEQKPRRSRVGNITDNNSDYDDDAKEFLRLEKRKLENSIRIEEKLENIASELSSLRDVMIQIKDALVNNRINM